MNPPTLPLGAALRPAFALEADWLTVNHGSFGATPHVVLAAQTSWRARMEAQPSRFMRSILPGALREAAGALAAFMGAQGEDLVFVENTTVGCNAVLGSLPLAEGDEVVVLSHGYGAVVKAARHFAARAGARVVVAETPFPETTEAGVLAGLAAALSSRTRVAVLDHITSMSGIVLPIGPMIALCRAAGVPVLVDGAHAPGQLALDLPKLGADWYVGNCHKWLMAPKGAAFLWAAPEAQPGLHPVTISHGYGEGFLAEFDWTGTRDPSACLAVTAALEFFEKLGGTALMARNRALAIEGAASLARRLNTEAGPGGAMAGSMATVRLPLPGALPGEMDQPRARRFMDVLLRAGCDAPVNALAGNAWLRLSAAAYNAPEDYVRLGETVADLLREAE